MSHSFSNNLAEIARNGGFILCDENFDETRVDWRFIASIDSHRIIKESDFEKLDECIPFLIKSSLSNLLNTRILDPAISKIFSLSQLSLQYLLFCTKFLDKSISSLRENLYNYQEQNIELQEALKEYKKEVQNVKKKVRKHEINSLEIYPCSKCTKNFESQPLLDSHMLRKHRESKNQDSNLINTIKLELEIKQLKEKLNQTEKELMEAKIVECQKCQQNANRIFKNIGIQINSEEKEKDDMAEKEDPAEKLNDTIRKIMADQMKQFQDYRQNDEKRHEEEISELRCMLDRAVESLKQKENKAPLPLPRYNIGIQASDESINLPSQIKTSIENENLWKTRFLELEKMYENNQAQMAQSMKDMEKAYAEKMNKLEDSMRQLKDERSTYQPVVRYTEHKDIIPNVLVRNKMETSSSENEITEEMPTKIPKAEKELPMKSETIFSNQQQSEKEKIKRNKKTFSAQKWFRNFQRDHQKEDIDTTLLKENDQLKRSKADKMFNDRLKELNVNDRRMSCKVDEIQSKLANRRENQKKLYPNFFITRKKIKTKVDEIFKNTTRSNDVASTKRNSLEYIQNVISRDINQNQLEEKPKKKVLFNLDERLEPIVKSNEDSDFDITSLEDDIK